MLVCDSVVVDCDDVVALDDVSELAPTVVVVAAVASSESLVELDELEALVPLEVLPVLAAATVDDVVVAL